MKTAFTKFFFISLFVLFNFYYPKTFSQTNFNISINKVIDGFYPTDFEVGSATISYTPGSQGMYLSIGSQQFTGSLSIIVSNLYLPGNDFGTAGRSVTTEFNLSSLLSPGQNTFPANGQLICYFHIFTLPQCYPYDPSTHADTKTVTVTNFFTYAQGLNSFLFPLTQFEKTLPVETPCVPGDGIVDMVTRQNAPNLDLNDSQNGDNATFAGDLNACVPTATANSMAWLDETYSSIFLGGKTLRQIMQELSSFMKRARNEGTFSDSMIIGKMNFIKANNLPIEVKYQSYFETKAKILKGSSGETARNFNSDTGNVKPEWDFLKQMMKDGEDVEMNYTWLGSDDKWYGHSVFVTGYTESANGTKTISFNHDRDQDNVGGTITQTDTVQIDSVGWMRIGPKKNKFIKDIVVESPTPEFGKAAAVWLNEFFPVGGTLKSASTAATNEFIEVVLNQNITDPQNYRVTVYDASGLKINTFTLNQFTVGALQDSFKIYTYTFPGNVLPDVKGGIGIAYKGVPISPLFVSYGGSLTAQNGDWTTYASTNTGLAAEPGKSIALTGTGTNYQSFIWTSSSIPSAGVFNPSQAIPVELVLFTASVERTGVMLKWSTATETNNAGFEIERALLKSISGQASWEKIGFIKGAGTIAESKEYSFLDKNISVGKYSYRLKQLDLDGSFKYIKTVQVSINTPVKYELAQNYPNPFNPVTSIQYSLPEAAMVKITVFNLLGETVSTLVNEVKEPGVYRVEFNGSRLNSGVYFYRLESGLTIITRKMLMIK